MSDTPGGPAGDPGRNDVSSGSATRIEPERRNAAIGVGVLVLVAAGIVGAAIVFTDPPQPPQADGLSVLDDANAPPADPDAPEEDVAADDPGETPEGLVEPEGDDQDELSDEPSEEDAEEAPRGVLIDFDGVCRVILAGVGDDDAEEAGQADEVPDEPRPWHFDECTSAPVTLDDRGDQRWIVVLASLPRSSYDEVGARGRADELGFDDLLLYSSHYPSLNPELWVVYDGPFTDEDEARAAAAEHGGGAYPRQLADESGDRYEVESRS